MQMHDHNRTTPHLSLVIPVYNGGKRMRANLDEVQQFLASQPYQSELLLVDDGNAEAGARTLREFAACHPAVTVIRNETNRGKGFSVARGIRAARGDYRIFTDADLASPSPR
jgi:dolichyl-phosphate beta-glucosyltransferase